MQLYSAIGPKNWIFSNAAHEKVDARVLLRAFATSRGSTGGCYIFCSQGKGGRRIRRGVHVPAFEGNVLILFALRFSLESPKLG